MGRVPRRTAQETVAAWTLNTREIKIKAIKKGSKNILTECELKEGDKERMRCYESLVRNLMTVK